MAKTETTLGQTAYEARGGSAAWARLTEEQKRDWERIAERTGRAMHAGLIESHAVALQAKAAEIEGLVKERDAARVMLVTKATDAAAERAELKTEVVVRDRTIAKLEEEVARRDEVLDRIQALAEARCVEVALTDDERDAKYADEGPG